jgi:predicted transcriptional regulator
MATLEVKVGEPIEASLARAARTMQAIEDGREVEPYFGIGFETMTQFGEVFTPKRWELVETLKAAGPSTIYALAKRLKRHYRNVYRDVSALMEWMVIEKDESGRVSVPWDEIDVRLPLARRAA